ncbi:MAG: flippase-like domain-containing protein [Caldilineaceae bacterium]|nr:flippase-like domain-containing protein [Caldilineaceae bacterium]
MKGAWLKSPLIAKVIYTLVPLGVIGLMAWLVIKNRQMILQFPWQIHWPSLLLASAFHSLALLVTYWVWHLLIDRFSGFNDPWANLRIYYVSTLAKRIPSSIPYISGRLVLYRQVGVSSAVVLNSILLENLLLGIAGGFVLVIFWNLYTGEMPAYVAYSLAAIALALLTGIALRFDALRNLGNRLLRRLNLAELEHSPTARDFLLWTSLYALPWLLAGASLYFGVRGVTDSVRLTLGDALAISTLSTLVSLLNLILPVGFGLKEVSMSALLLPWMPTSVAILFSLAYRLLHTLDEVGWALLVLAISGRSRNIAGQNAQNPASQEK